MHAFAKPLLIGALVASCAWAIHGLREAQAPSAEPLLASAATTASTPDSRSPLAHRPVPDPAEPVASAPPDAQPKASTEPRPGADPPPARGGPGAPLREATTSTPPTPAPPPAAASIALPAGVTTQDVAISPAGMLAVVRRAPNATPPSDDSAAYGAAAASGRPAAVLSQ